MSAIQTPDDYVPALRGLAQMPEEQFDDLMQVAAGLQSLSAAQQFASRVRAEAAVDPEVSDNLLDAIMSMMTYAEAHDIPLDDLVRRISQSANLDLSDESQLLLETRLRTLAVDGPIRIWHKSTSLSLEYKNVFVDSRIVTDVRPVFGERVDDGMRAALIIHSLRIDSIKDGKHYSEYIAMDGEDLHNLRDTIDRAIEKSSSVRTMLRASSVLHLDMEN